VAPAPAWVDAEPYTIPATANPHFIANGVCVLLDESQIDLCGPERGWFYRRADMVTASAGAEQAAQFAVSFDPAFERVEVHAITVIRGEQRIEHAPNAFYEVLRRERNMERLQFDGRLTACVTIPDVRAGDVVETSYTRYGARKSLGGRHGNWMPFEWPVGIVEVRVRQRAPRSRVICERGYHNPPQATERVIGDVVERRWRSFERAGFKYEPLTPPWELQSASIQWSEWKDWREVADMFAPLYDEDGPLPPEAEAEVERIAAHEHTAKDKAAAVLRFAQSHLRYLAISIGEGGYTPRKLGDICSTRYGDCKDKSKLYVAMAKRLGLDACPALVNTRDGYLLNDCLPTGQVFDHCIVRVAVDGNVYWVDPTRLLQPSPMDKLSQCHFGWALPLRADATGLERMPEPPVSHLTETKETVTLGDRPSVPVRYEWEHKHRDVRAEMIRDQFARDGAVTVFKGYVDDIQRVWPKARVASQEVVKDDVANNEITVREVYEIDDAWETTDDRAYRFQTRDLTLRGSLAPLDPGQRRFDIFLGVPGRRTRHVDIRTAMKHSGAWSRGSGFGPLSFSDQLRAVTPKWLVLEQILVVGGLTLPAKDAETYRQVVSGLGQNELVITEILRGKKFSSNGRGGGRQGGDGFVSAFGYVVLFLFIMGVLARFASYFANH